MNTQSNIESSKVQAFVKKPVQIQAIKFTYPPSKEFLDFVGNKISKLKKDRHLGSLATAVIAALEDSDENSHQVEHVITEGDWLIKGIKGEFYPIKEDIFLESYQELTNA